MLSYFYVICIEGEQIIIQKIDLKISYYYML